MRQFFIGGMHIHAGFGDDDRRIEVMHALRGYLAVFLVLSCSSPFQGGRLTGLKSCRQMAIGALPRTGTPPVMRTRGDYEAVVERYRAIEAIEDGSELRWDIRPSASYATIELRICDICPRIEDAVAIAALYACLIRHLDARLEAGERVEVAPAESIEEGRWIAQRYGTFSFLPHPHGGEGRVDVAEIVCELVSTLADDARTLGCEAALARTSASSPKAAAPTGRKMCTVRPCSTERTSEKPCVRSSIQSSRRPRTRRTSDGACRHVGARAGNAVSRNMYIPILPVHPGACGGKRLLVDQVEDLPRFIPRVRGTLRWVRAFCTVEP